MKVFFTMLISQCSSHCPFNAERQAGKLLKVIDLTRLVIKPESNALEADAPVTWLSVVT